MDLLRDFGLGWDAGWRRHPRLDPSGAGPCYHGSRLWRLCPASIGSSRPTLPGGRRRLGATGTFEPDPGPSLAAGGGVIGRRLYPIRKPDLRQHRATGRLVPRSNPPASCPDRPNACSNLERRRAASPRECSRHRAEQGWKIIADQISPFFLSGWCREAFIGVGSRRAILTVEWEARLLVTMIHAEGKGPPRCGFPNEI